jgi:hypothetical protein
MRGRPLLRMLRYPSDPRPASQEQPSSAGALP